MPSTREAFDLARFQFIANIKMSANPTNGFSEIFKFFGFGEKSFWSFDQVTHSHLKDPFECLLTR